MREVVLDASVVLKWLRTDNERHVDRAGALRDAGHRGELSVVAPRLLCLEVINAAGRAWRRSERELVEIALDLDRLGIYFRDADPAHVATWTSRGLSAYDASYVALAEERGITLVTDDEPLVAAAPEVAAALADVEI